MLLFIYLRIVYIFFSLPLPLPFLPLLSTLLQVLVFILLLSLSHSAISFLIVVSALSFLVPLSHSGFIHLLHHHQAGFPARLSSAPMPPELLVLLLPLEQLQFTHWWWGFRLEHLVSHWRKHPRELTVHGGLVLRPFFMLQYGNLCVTLLPCTQMHSLCYHIIAPHSKNWTLCRWMHFY